MNPGSRWFPPAVLALALQVAAAQVRIAPHTFTVPDGFELELVAGPPLVLRPMMADFDDQGRLYVADSSGSNARVEQQLEEKPHRIVRLEDTDGDGRFDASVVFADKLMFPEGVLWHEGAVYTGAPPTVWKLEDTDGDGVADRRTEWHQGKTLTGCANDLHGPYLGPDGWLYWCKGAFARQTYERPGHRPIDDSAAHVFRALPDHSALDAVMGGGMDNPVEAAFGRDGEVFFITTFFHHPEAGLRDAVVHCIYGGAYPKVHGAIDGLQRTGELLPPLVELGPAAACALTRYDSTALGPEFENDLFSTEFNLRKVMRHELEPFGSTYRAKNSDFLVADNPDFHPTDVFEDADGSLLVVDTGGWYKICCPTSQLAKPDVLGGIYRLRRTGMPPVPDPRGLKLDWDGASPAALVARLGEARPAVRNRAIRQLAHAGPGAIAALRTALQPATPVLARQNAVWALTRSADPAARAAVRIALDDADAGIQQAALHSVAVRRDAGALPRVLALLSSTNRFHQRKAAEALGRIGDPAAVPALLATAGTFRDGFPPDAAAVRIHEHALIFALVEIADAAGTRAGLTADNPYTRRAALIAVDQMDGGGLQAAEVAPLLASADPVLKATAAWIASQHPAWGGELAGFFRQRLTVAGLTAVEQAELQHQLALFARETAIQDVIADGLGDGALSQPTRLLLLRAMAASGLKAVPARWLEALAGRLGEAEVELVRGAIATARALPLGKTNLTVLTGALGRVGRDAARPAAVRVAALAAIPAGPGTLDPALFDLLLAQLDSALPAGERSAAVTVLTRATLAPAQQEALAGALATVGPMELNGLLDAFTGVTAEPVGRRLVAALLESRALGSVRVDLLRQRLAQFPAGVQEAGMELLRRLDIDPAKQAARLESLLAELKQAGGDVRRGQLVFNSQKTACATCHAMGYLGGKVGPDLTSIGQIRTDRDLVEAVVFPSASFVRSYEPVIVTTRDGEEYSGVVANDTAEELLLTTGADTRMRLAKPDITEMRPGTVSVMPSGLDEQLSRQELADLIAFLQGTKWGAQ